MKMVICLKVQYIRKDLILMMMMMTNVMMMRTMTMAMTITIPLKRSTAGRK